MKNKRAPSKIELHQCGALQENGADGVRVGLLLSSAAGNDLMFEEDLCQQGKQFANKIWNAFRLVQGWEVDHTISQPESSKIAIEWFESKFQKTILEIEDHFSKYRLSDALMSTYKLIWDGTNMNNSRLPDGIYMIQFKSNDHFDAKPIIMAND